MKKTFEKKDLTKKSENLSEWYQDVVTKAGLADYSDVKGSIVIRPYAYAIWETVQSVLDSWFKEAGIKNCYFPLLIPISLVQKEKDHLKGFSPELAIVDYAGGEKLAEPLVVRPTSETIMYKSFADWIQSYRDLPLLINQWCNIVRWEKRTYPFLRTSEFLWQEGHTAHATPEEAEQMTLDALAWYKRFYEEVFAISLYAGLKSQGETFAGADHTYAIETVMPDGKALQSATSHNLSDHFSKVFDIEFLDEKGKKQHPYQTSWGFSTRSIGALVLTHGDDFGLIMPPKAAPVQVIILPVAVKDEAANKKILDYAEEVKKLLKGKFRVELDAESKSSLGFRINRWELQGVPLRLEIGPKELENKSLRFARRDNFEKGDIKFSAAVSEVSKLLDEIQAFLYDRSDKLKKDLTKSADNFEDFRKIMATKKSFIRVKWCERAECEQAVKEQTKATPRVLELQNLNKRGKGKCFACGQEADREWLFAQSY
ncbi:MAG: proline--tRNA ligase [Acidobacteriaceae bacterium]